MHKKVICVIANGYAEEMMATKLMSKIRAELDDKGLLNTYQFVGGSLVSSGRWYQEDRFATFFSGGVTPSGGFPTRSIKGFFDDAFSGAFKAPFTMANFIKKWQKNNLTLVIVVGDFLLMATALPAINKTDIPLVFIPTAKSDYIQSHFNIEKYFIKKHAALTFPRDQITADDFVMYGINAEYHGNIMQDLIDPHQALIPSAYPMIALLPGSREEAYKNITMILSVVELITQNVEWVMVQASSLDSMKLADIFTQSGWSQENTPNQWVKQNHKITIYTNEYYDSIALSCDLAISLAGTAGEQIVGLGKVVIGFKGAGAQTTHQRMLDNSKLLGKAFIYEQNFPHGVVTRINSLLNNPQEKNELIKDGKAHMGDSGGTEKIAKRIVNEFLK